MLHLETGKSKVLANGLKTLISIKALLPLAQNPRADTSTLASSCVFADRFANFSPVRFVNFGSNVTSLQISDNKSAVVSLSSLCRIDIKPPVLQDNACLMVKALPHTQCMGSFSRSIP